MTRRGHGEVGRRPRRYLAAASDPGWHGPGGPFSRSGRACPRPAPPRPGLHDIAAVLLFVCGERLAWRMLSALVACHLRDCTRRELGAATEMLRLLYPILEVCDPELHAYIQARRAAAGGGGAGKEGRCPGSGAPTRGCLHPRWAF